jgi:hypothetical protein
MQGMKINEGNTDLHLCSKKSSLQNVKQALCRNKIQLKASGMPAPTLTPTACC